MSPAPGRSVALDILRAAAIFLVLGRHMPPGSSGIPTVDSLLELWKRGGWIGVDLFFVLSGFLVSGLLFKEHKRAGKIDLKVFYIRRAFRIYPPFFAMLLFTVIIRNLRGESIPGMNLLAEALFFQNYHPGLWLHTWSLAVEEHFYALVPLLVLALWKRNPSQPNPFRLLPLLFIFLALTCLLARILTAQSGSFSFSRSIFPTHLRIDSLFFGTVLAYFSIYYAAQFRAFIQAYRWPFVLLGIALSLPAFIWLIESTPWLATYGLAILFLGSGCILLGVEGLMIPASNRFIRLLSGIGRHSYSIYLWHFVVLSLTLNLSAKFFPGESHFLTRLILYLSGSLIVGWILSALLEAPILKLRDRLFPSRSGSIN